MSHSKLDRTTSRAASNQLRIYEKVRVCCAMAERPRPHAKLERLRRQWRNFHFFSARKSNSKITENSLRLCDLHFHFSNQFSISTKFINFGVDDENFDCITRSAIECKNELNEMTRPPATVRKRRQEIRWPFLRTTFEPLLVCRSATLPSSIGRALANSVILLLFNVAAWLIHAELLSVLLLWTLGASRSQWSCLSAAVKCDCLIAPQVISTIALAHLVCGWRKAWSLAPWTKQRMRSNRTNQREFRKNLLSFHEIMQNTQNGRRSFGPLNKWRHLQIWTTANWIPNEKWPFGEWTLRWLMMPASGLTWHCEIAMSRQSPQWPSNRADCSNSMRPNFDVYLMMSFYWFPLPSSHCAGATISSTRRLNVFFPANDHRIEFPSEFSAHST